MSKIFPLLLLSISLAAVSAPVAAQNSNERDQALKIFLDIDNDYESFVKKEITFVNYVRDRMQAQVFVMMTTQRTGSNGREYTLVLYGQQNFTGMNDTLVYTSKQSDTEDMTRHGILHKLKMGLMHYVSHTPLADYISITYLQEEVAAEDVTDRWDHWVFNLELDTDLRAEESEKSYELDGSISADRVTENWKMSFNLFGDYEEERYAIDSGDILSVSRSWGTRALMVKSLGRHWSAGGYVSTRSSTYSNLDFSLELAPAIEYNIFPYEESTHREFRLLYQHGLQAADYREMTIYNKMKETLWYESLAASFVLQERWGYISLYLKGRHYFHDFSKNYLYFNTRLSLRLFEGFSLYIRASASQIHDQLGLERGGATEQDILLHRREIASSYEYRFVVGFQYTFGSIYNNIVNPRFGNDND